MRRFIYHRYDGGDLAPPHGAWDTAQQRPAGEGTWPTEELARAYVSGLNAGMKLRDEEHRRSVERFLSKIRSELDP